MKIKPISPKDVKGPVIPEEVIQAVNEILSKAPNKKYIRFTQKDVLNILERIAPTLNTEEIFKNHLLDFEKIFMRAGWEVSFDKPAYNEDYQPFWIFSAK